MPVVTGKTATTDGFFDLLAGKVRLGIATTVNYATQTTLTLPLITANRMASANSL